MTSSHLYELYGPINKIGAVSSSISVKRLLFLIILKDIFERIRQKLAESL